MTKTRIVFALALFAFAQCPSAVAADGSTAASRAFRDAPRIQKPEKAPILAATRAGNRVVAVGDYGIVILADDGTSFRQAKAVPTRSVLTSVFFLDDKQGWAAGHDGTVIASSDGGETWRVLREELGKERALLSVWFENTMHGLAVGQFGLVVETEDGGKSWRERKLVDAGEAGEKHLLQIFAANDGLVLVAAEAGAVFRSEDNGHNWKPVQTDNKGSFWTGLALHDGSLLVAGMRGHIYRSSDRGLSWKEVPDIPQQSLTSIVQGKNSSVYLVGMSGTALASKDQGLSFAASVRPDRANLTATTIGPNGLLLFTLAGVVVDHGAGTGRSGK
ncbi:MAG: glycosyl hydrolase [Rhodocyclaceae bacterium]|nr:MAG: glycosyl hydrolase [Rhodocyclaceae bacterium]